MNRFIELMKADDRFNIHHESAVPLCKPDNAISEVLAAVQRCASVDPTAYCFITVFQCIAFQHIINYFIGIDNLEIFEFVSEPSTDCVVEKICVKSFRFLVYLRYSTGLTQYCFLNARVKLS